MICAVGCVTGLRDYPTLFEAIHDVDVQAELAVGSFINSPEHSRGRRRSSRENVPEETVPGNVRYSSTSPTPSSASSTPGRSSSCCR